MSSLTESRANILNIILTTSGSIGLASSCYLCYFLYTNHRMLRNPAGRLIISMAFCDIINGIFKIIGRHWIGKGALCSFQAFILQQFSLSEWILCTLLAGYSVLIVCYGKSINYFKKTEALFLALSFAMPLPFSITAAVLPQNIGDAQLHCWISTDKTYLYQLYLYIIPMLALMALNLYCVGAISIVSFRYGQSNIWGETVTYKKYIMIRFFGYQLLFWVSYIPTLINRLTTQPLYPLLIFQATMSPLQGTLHFFIFFYVWQYNPIRETEQQEYEEMNVFTPLPRESTVAIISNPIVTGQDSSIDNIQPDRNRTESNLLRVIHVGSTA